MKDNKIRCGKCKSTQVYYRRTDNMRVCAKCGYVEEVNLKEGR